MDFYFGDIVVQCKHLALEFRSCLTVQILAKTSG
jgi:hypothetical protein